MKTVSALLLSLAWALPAAPLAARDIFVPGPAQLSGALKAAKPGDVLTLKNGIWKDAKLVVSQGGRAGQPVEIRAESPGGVTLSGASFLEINAPYVTIDGLLFHGGATTRASVIQFKSHHGVVRHTAIIDYNPPGVRNRMLLGVLRGRP